MCLLSKDKELKEAPFGITCYKVLKVMDYEYVTPCVRTRVPYDVIDGKTPLIATGEEEIDENEIALKINGGFIHVFKSSSDASNYAQMEDLLKDGSYKIFLCEIPRGTKYYSGEFLYCGKLESYAAKQIRFIKEICTLPYYQQNYGITYIHYDLQPLKLIPNCLI